VVELELHEAVQPGELRHQPVQQVVFAQGVDGRMHAAGLGQHRPEGARGFVGEREVGREQVGAFADKEGQGPFRAGLMDLAMAEQPDEPARILLEDEAMLGGDRAAADDAQTIDQQGARPTLRARARP